MRFDCHKLHRFIVTVLVSLVSMGMADEATVIRWEAESATTTNMTTEGNYRPTTNEQKQKLSGGAWLNGKVPKNTKFHAAYSVTVPKDANYRFFIRKFWHHGPFQYRFDDSKWVKVAHHPPIVDSVGIKRGVPVSWMEIGTVQLKAGDHKFELELLQGKQYQFTGNFGIDCFLLIDNGDIPQGISGLKPDPMRLLAKMKPMPPRPPANNESLIVDQSHPNSSDVNPGTADRPFKTIDAAAQKAIPGNTILVKPGLYRETIHPAKSGTEEKPIRYIAARPRTVIVRGSEVWKPEWQGIKGGLYRASMAQPFFPAKGNPFLKQLNISHQDPHKSARPVRRQNGFLPRTLGQIFVNGKMYTQARLQQLVERTPGTWMVALDGRSIWVHFKPGDQPELDPVVEVSLRQALFMPSGENFSFIQVKGFVFEHCANQGPFPQLGAVSVRGGHHWRIEENVIRFANTIGLDCGWRNKKPCGYNLIQKNTVADNGLCGIAGIGHTKTVIQRNLVERNNSLGFDMPEAKWAEWAGIKLHICNDVQITDNVVRNNEGYGIWLDNQYKNARVSRNVVINNTMAGIFFELGDGPALIDCNIVAHTRRRGAHYRGDGIYAHDASGLTIANNLIYSNTGDGVRLLALTNRRTQGHPVECSNQTIANNIIIGNNGVAISLPFPNGRAKNNRSNENYLFGTQDYHAGIRPFPALMAINHYRSSFNWQTHIAGIKQALVAKKIPEGEWPNFSAWGKHPVVNLKLWQRIMGQDTRSLEGYDRIKVQLYPLQDLLEITVKKDFIHRSSPKVEGTTVDFFGNKLSEKGVRRGPFQNLRTGVNQISLSKGE